MFGIGKKKQEKLVKCDCGGMCSTSQIKEKKEKEQCKCKINDDNKSRIKVLGSGCKKCNQLEQEVKKALEELFMDTNIEHVTQYSEIASYGVMSTPALVIDEKVVSYGKVLNKDEVIAIIKKEMGE